jgi:MYXO-CTERM domain-containing protein
VATSPADASTYADAKAAPDGAIFSSDAASAADGPATDALARDAAAEKPKGGGHGGCSVAARGQTPLPALLLLVPLLLRRRRRL